MKLGDLSIPSRRSSLAASTEISSLAFDSRRVHPGTLFFAVSGTQMDGHQFVDQALEAGAAGVVVEREEVYGRLKGAILVDSARRALAEAAHEFHGRPSEHLGLVGVTGTNGKTTCAFLLHQVWEKLGHRAGLVGTVEIRIGEERRPSRLTTPDPLVVHSTLKDMVDAGLRWVAMEVSSIALDQFRPGGCHFAAAIFTNFTQDHLDYHGDLDGYFAAKSRLFRDYPLGTRVLNGEDPRVMELAEEGDAIFGEGGTFRAVQARYSMLGSEVTVETPDGEVTLKTPLIGAHNVANCLAVMATCQRLGLPQKDVLSALATCPGAPGRLERVAGSASGGPYVFVDYAHTDDALRNVMEALNPLKGEGRLITVFGCGGDRDRRKRPRMAEVVCRLSDVTVATSDNPRTEDPDQILNDLEAGVDRSGTEYHRQVDRRAAIGEALALASPQDLVLVAGKGHEDYQDVGGKKIHFDDREVVREFFSR